MECPVCEKAFGGTSAQLRLNTHCKKEHLPYYREHIRPLKDPKLISREAYQRQKAKDPEKIRHQRLLSRLKKKAKTEQINRLVRGAPLNRPKPQAPAHTKINPYNPFYIVEFRLKIFIGVQLADLLAFPISSTLEHHLQMAAGGSDTATVIAEAIIVLESRNTEALALEYCNYRQAVRDVETYPERLRRYETQMEVETHKTLAPENYIDNELLTQRTEQLYQQHLQSVNRKVDSARLLARQSRVHCTIQDIGNNDLPSTRDDCPIDSASGG